MKMIIWCVSLLVFNIKSFYRLFLYSPLNSHPKLRLVMSFCRTPPSGKLNNTLPSGLDVSKTCLYENARTIISLLF